jgi:hypothetical protein
MFWLVEGTISETPYMGDTTTRQHRCLVQADDWAGAERKYIEWWEAKSADYSIHYQVLDCTVHETIT